MHLRFSQPSGFWIPPAILRHNRQILLSSLDELLDKIRDDQSTSAIQVNAVRMETPVIDSGDFVRAFAQHQSSESIPVKRKKFKLCERATR
jgi:hypothetical protein